MINLCILCLLFCPLFKLAFTSLLVKIHQGAMLYLPLWRFFNSQVFLFIILPLDVDKSNIKQLFLTNKYLETYVEVSFFLFHFLICQNCNFCFNFLCCNSKVTKLVFIFWCLFYCYKGNELSFRPSPSLFCVNFFLIKFLLKSDKKNFTLKWAQEELVFLTALVSYWVHIFLNQNVLSSNYGF